MVVGVEEQVIACKHHTDIEQNGTSLHDVEFDSCSSETLKEARTNLQTYHEDKEYQSKVLHEVQRGWCSCESDMSGEDARKQNEGDSQGDASDFNFAQINTCGNDN